jgi:polyisoprenoid-binding protein YceI
MTRSLVGAAFRRPRAPGGRPGRAHPLSPHPPACGLALLLCLAAGATSVAQTAPQAWTVRGGDVRVTCPLTVGGSFEARTSSMTGKLAVNPASATLDGQVSVDVSTLDTGISLRNEHMRETYLEVQKGDGYRTAVLSRIGIGALGPQLPTGTRPFTAQLRLHGVEKPVSGRATLTRRGETIRVEASFPVRLSDYAIPDPRYLGVGVRDEVTVHAVMTATPAS